MPAQGPGARHTAVATKQCLHGQIVTEDNFVGSAFKVKQMPVHTAPGAAALRTIEVGEIFEIEIGGVQEAAAAAGIAAAAVGDKIWIHPADNTLIRTGAVDGDIPVGIVDEINVIPTPDIVKINTNAIAAFFSALIVDNT